MLHDEYIRIDNVWIGIVDQQKRYCQTNSATVDIAASTMQEACGHFLLVDEAAHWSSEKRDQSNDKRDSIIIGESQNVVQCRLIVAIRQ
jgi:hypothetical protein